MYNITPNIANKITCNFTMTICRVGGDALFDEGTVNVEHYQDRHCSFANSHLGYLKLESNLCLGYNLICYLVYHYLTCYLLVDKAPPQLPGQIFNLKKASFVCR